MIFEKEFPRLSVNPPIGLTRAILGVLKVPETTSLSKEVKEAISKSKSALSPPK